MGPVYVLPPDLTSPSREAALARLSALLLAFVVTLCGLATLAPFQFTVPHGKAINWHVGAHDVLLNLLLMFPSGFVYALLRQPNPALNRRQHGLRVVGAAVGLFSALSLVLEALQWFLPHRTTSGVDVLCNSAGAGLGALMMVALQPWLRARLENELTLRLPLSHLFYLITLLLVVDSLMRRSGGPRAWTAVPLGLCGALVVVAIARHRQTPLGTSRLRTAAFTTVWFALANPFSLSASPRVAAVGASGIFATTWVAHALCLPRVRGRRFETATLKLLGLPFLVYLGLLWHGYSWLDAVPRRSAAAEIQWTYDAIEALAAMSVFGYALAEASGRRAWPGFVAPLLSGLSAGALLAAAGAAIPFRLDAQDHGPDAWWPVAAAGVFAAWGAFVYRAELQVVRALSRGRTVAALAAQENQPRSALRRIAE